VAEPVRPGVLDARNGRAVLQTLDLAVQGALAGAFAAIVTAPLQKSTINDAGVAFTGHTEYLAEVRHAAGGDDAGRRRCPHLRVALATTHLALKDVPAAITAASLARTLDILQADLRGKFGIASRASWSPA
jgi:4-hydroxythreonine-4-phosphate dehydrogenase